MAELRTLERQSVQEHEPPDSLGAPFWYALPSHDPNDDVLLDEWGLHHRDRQLRTYYRNQYNWLAQAAVAALVRKFTQTPYIVRGGRNLSSYFQTMLQDANFDDGWSTFWSQVLLDYLTCDYGGYIEIIGGGKPDKPLRGRVSGIAHLDSLRCVPTGNLEFPVVYQSRRTSKLHRLHHTRVERLVDMPDGDESFFGAGLCALSRAIALIQQQIPLMRYVSGQLNDVPQAGQLFLTGLAASQYTAAMDEYKRRREQGYKGPVAISGNSGQEIKAQLVTFAVAPEGFNYTEYIDIAVNAFATAFGIDRQDLWPLSGKMSGTATQSNVMAEKAMGMAFGDLLSRVKRLVNTRILPPSLEFDFEYRDEEKDKLVADRTAVLIGNANSLKALGTTTEIALRYLAAQDETLRDVLLDEKGELVVLPDDDVLEAEQTETTPAAEVIETDAGNNTADDAKIADETATKKELSKSAFAYIPLANHPDILRVQRDLKGRFPDEGIEWQTAPTLHITLCFAGQLDDKAIEKISTLIHLEALELQPVQGNALDVFDTPDGKALHIRILRTSVLDAIQANVYSALLTEAYDLSNFSAPGQWIPHITLAYLPDDVAIDTSELNATYSWLDSVVIPSDTIIIGRDDYDPVLILTAPHHVKSFTRQKDIATTEREFTTRFASLIQEVQAGETNERAAKRAIRSLIYTYGSRGYGDGMEIAGVDRNTMDADDEARIQYLAAQQFRYIDDFVEVLFDKTLTDKELEQKPELWFNGSIMPFVWSGQLHANPDMMYEFVYGPTEHCDDCLTLNGQIHTMQDYVASGWLPRSRQLQCTGLHCQCGLVPRPGAEARGMFPSLLSRAA